MSETSPLFISSIELIAHAIDLYVSRDAKKLKFAILHLANAVELILKDRVVDCGQSIYKDNSKQTITIWEAFKILEGCGVLVPEKPVIELLVDDRNTIQHRYGYPNGEAVFHYLQQTLAFFTRFLSENYGVELRATLQLHTSRENLEKVGFAFHENEAIATIEELFKLSPDSALLVAWKLLDERLSPYLSSNGRKGKPAIMLWHHSDFQEKLKLMQAAGLVGQQVFEDFLFLREMRNKAAHAQHHEQSQPEEWRKAIDVAEALITATDRAVKQGVLASL